jgi:hypothetical protein
MEKQYNENQYVLVVISPRYVQEFNQAQQSASGARFEGALLSAFLLAQGVDYSRLAVVIIRPEDKIDLPPILSGCQRYYIYQEGGYELLYRFLTAQPRVSAPELGAIRRLPLRPTPANVEFPAIGQVRTFRNLCSRLSPLMVENRRIFEDFGPKSGVNAGSVRWDTSLWQRLRREKIVPANTTLHQLINANWEVIPAEYRSVFRKLLSHIDAFEEHTRDPGIDYRDLQFPNEITEIIERNSL